MILNQEGYSISRPTTAKYMNEMGLEAIYPKKNLSVRNPEHKVYPYLLRNVRAKHPNHEYESPRELREGLSNFFHHYNYCRPHQSLGYQTPAKVYFNEENE